MSSPTSVDDHISNQNKETQEMLRTLRGLVLELVPEAVECIKYGIPTFILHGKNLVHYAGYSGIEAFKKDLEPYIKGKGSLQFPLNSPLPLSLIRKVIKFRAKETIAKGMK
jgi:uncharacterized protein YdhG (YjbR/CyaY superfamily)